MKKIIFFSFSLLMSSLATNSLGFIQADVDYVLQYKKCNPASCNLSAASFFQANLKNANLSGANLYAANLLGTDLTNANLANADLRSANLHGCNLKNANLTDTKFDNTIFMFADLTNAKLARINNLTQTSIIFNEYTEFRNAKINPFIKVHTITPVSTESLRIKGAIITTETSFPPSYEEAAVRK